MSLLPIRVIVAPPLGAPLANKADKSALQAEIARAIAAEATKASQSALDALVDDLSETETALTDAINGKATTAQGAKADSAVQPNDPITSLAETSTAKILTAAERTKLAGIAAGATPNDTDANLRARANHTGTQAIGTVAGLQGALDGKATTAQGTKADTAVQPGALDTAIATRATAAQGTKADSAVQPGAAVSVLVETSTAKILTGDERAKLSGIAAGATINAADAALRDRSTHTGSQAISTVTGLGAALEAKATTASVDQERTDRTAVDDALSDFISAANAARVAGDAAEATARTAGDAANATAIGSETTRATGVEAAHDTRIHGAEIKTEPMTRELRTAGSFHPVRDVYKRVGMRNRDDGTTEIAILKRPGPSGTMFDRVDVWDDLDGIHDAIAGLTRSANTRALISSMRANALFPQPLSRTQAAVPNDVPSISVGAGGAVSAINGAAAGQPNVLLTSPSIQWLGGASIAGPNGSWRGRGGYYGSGTRFAWYTSIEFVHVGNQFDVAVVGDFRTASDNLRVIVNGRIAALASVPQSDGQLRYCRVIFPTSAPRDIRIETTDGPIRGINVVSPSEISSPLRAMPMVTVLVDSYVEPYGVSPLDGQAATMLRDLGLNPAIAGVGGTGYLNTSGGRPNWQDSERIKDLTLAGVTDAITGQPVVPAMGVVCGSINDAPTGGPLGSSYWGGAASFQDAIHVAAWRQVDAWAFARPGKPLVFFGPYWPYSGAAGKPPLDLYRIRDAMREVAHEAASANVHFVERLQPETMLRSGIYSEPTDQASLYSAADGHPTAQGHRYDGLWMAEQLRRLILSEFA